MLAKTESVSEYFVIVELIRSNVHLSNEMILYRATQVKPCSSSVVFNQELQAATASLHGIFQHEMLSRIRSKNIQEGNRILSGRSRISYYVILRIKPANPQPTSKKNLLAQTGKQVNTQDFELNPNSSITSQ